MFSESLFEIHHSLMSSNSWLTIGNKYLTFWCVKNKLVSSNTIGFNMFVAFFEHKIEPCGTPQLTVSKLDFSFYLIFLSRL